MLVENLKYLRKKNQVSQQMLADAIGMSRSSIGDYEQGRAEPDINTLIAISKYFDVLLDDLLKKDLKKEDYEILRNKDFRVLAITVDNDNRENIELVDTKAEAGYIESFNDPEYIRDLPKLYFPNIPEGTYRAFEIRGDSMLPMEPGNVVICSYVESFEEIKDGKTYVIVGKSGTLVYKRVRPVLEENRLLLISDNDIYPPFTMLLEEVAEIWEFYAHISHSDPKEYLEQMIDDKIDDIQNKVKTIYKKILN